MKRKLIYFACLIIIIAGLMAIPAASYASVPPFSDLDEMTIELPDQVTVESIGTDGSPYMTVLITNGAFLDGTYDGWCFDADHYISDSIAYEANVYSSYETLPAGLIEYPENLDIVNYILNQDYVGKTSPGGYGIYTYSDIQIAIWLFIDDNLNSAGISAYDQNRIIEDTIYSN